MIRFMGGNIGSLSLLSQWRWVMRFGIVQWKENRLMVWVLFFYWGWLALVATTAWGQNINTPDNFPDPNFRSCVEQFMGVKTGGEFSAAQAAIKSGTLFCLNVGIESVSGLQFFTALTSLICYDNQLTSLDVSKNAALQQLHCFNNQLTRLDVSQNTALTSLDCSNNQLTSIAGFVANSKLGGKIDVRNNELDCGDWEDVKILRARMGEPIFKTVSGVTHLSSGFAYSPQKGLDPYNCEPIDNWTEYESKK
jgi:Leucine-rich repeat (LRR) protein